MTTQEGVLFFLLLVAVLAIVKTLLGTPKGE